MRIRDIVACSREAAAEASSARELLQKERYASILKAAEILGSGNISAAVLLDNAGTIDATNSIPGLVSAANLNINYASGNYTNVGLLESTGNATLALVGNSGLPLLDNSNGIIHASGITQNIGGVFIFEMNIFGGFLSTDATGHISLSGSTLTGAYTSGNITFNSATLSNDTFSGSVSQSGPVTLSGTIINNADWTQLGGGYRILVSQNTTLSGNGTLTILHNIFMIAVNSATLTLGANQTLEGTGSIFGGVTVVNNGTIIANGGQLSFAGPFSTTVNLIVGSNSTFSAPQLLLAGGILAGVGTVAAPVVAGSSPHTIHPGMPASLTPGTLTLQFLSTNPNTTLAFNLLTPATSNTSSVNDRLVISSPNGLLFNGGSLQLTSAPTGPAAVGYYQLIQYAGSLTGLSSLILPTSTTNLLYTLDTTRDPNSLDLHIGLLGDANDDGQVDLSDLNTVLNNLGSATASWTAGNFDGAATIDLTDLNDVLNNLGMSFTVGSSVRSIVTPEPQSLAMLGLGTLLVRGRRQRCHRS